MKSFWVLQGCIAAVAAGAFAALGGACSSSAGGPGTGGAGAGTETNTDTIDFGTCTDTATDTCSTECSAATSFGGAVCAPEPYYAKLVDCASWKCPNECGGIVFCSLEVRDNPGCAGCLQSNCAGAWAECAAH